MWAQLYNNKVQRIIVGLERSEMKKIGEFMVVNFIGISTCIFALILFLRARIENSAFPQVCPTNKANSIKTIP